ncbi:cytochrome c oxidase assembly protein [Nocardioides marmoraquaticus]
MIRDTAAATTLGFLVLAACCVPNLGSKPHEVISGTRARLTVGASAAAMLWSLTCLALIAFSWSDAVGWSLTTPGALQQVAWFAVDFELGRALLLSAAIASCVAIGAIWLRRTTGLAVLVALAVLALWPLATVGHSAGDLNHDWGVNSLFAHLVGMSVWVGGIIGLVCVARRSPSTLAASARHFSPIAGACYIAVALSGTAAALLSVSSPADLVSAYGSLLVAKAVLLLLLGSAGWWHRRRSLARLEAGDTTAFTWLVAGEVALLCLAMALGVALARTDPPDASQVLSASQALLGYDLPPELTPLRWFSAWRVDSFFVPVAIVATWTYLRQVRRLQKRGDRWSPGRTIAWVAGWAVLVWATSGAPGVYGRVLFSMHMVQHMTIATAVPALLVLAAPVTLFLRSVPRRRDGTRGPREWLLALVHHRIARLLAHPLVAAPMFVGSLVVFYSTGLFELSLRSHTAHVVMVLHFLITGYLFASGLIGIDPGVTRPAFHYRMLLLMVTFGAHAFYSVSLMASTTVLAESWFDALGRTWGATLARDQYTGASIGWALGDYPLLIVGAALIVQWVKADHREQRRLDRRADRDGDADRTAYNAYLTSLSRHDNRG